MANTIVAQITSNARAAAQPTHLLVEAVTTEGRQAGLRHDSVVSCNNLATIEQSLIVRTIGSLSATSRAEVDACLNGPLQIA